MASASPARRPSLDAPKENLIETATTVIDLVTSLESAPKPVMEEVVEETGTVAGMVVGREMEEGEVTMTTIMTMAVEVMIARNAVEEGTKTEAEVAMTVKKEEEEDTMTAEVVLVMMTEGVEDMMIVEEAMIARNAAGEGMMIEEEEEEVMMTEEVPEMSQDAVEETTDPDQETVAPLVELLLIVLVVIEFQGRSPGVDGECEGGARSGSSERDRRISC